MRSPPPAVSSIAHQVDEVRAAAEVARTGRALEQRHGARRVVGALVAERPHPAATSAIAGTMFA
jgi:hypothetical protein